LKPGVSFLCIHCMWYCCRFDRLLREVTICLVGKYTRLQDSYASVVKALSHAAMACNYKLDLKVAIVCLSVCLLCDQICFMSLGSLIVLRFLSVC